MTGDVTINPTASCLVMTTEASRLSSSCQFLETDLDWTHVAHRFCDQCCIEVQKSCGKLHGWCLTKSTICETRVSFTFVQQPSVNLNAYPTFCRSRCGLGRDDYPFASLCPLRVLVCHYSQQYAICRVDSQAPQPTLPRRLYRL